MHQFETVLIFRFKQKITIGWETLCRGSLFLLLFLPVTALSPPSCSLTPALDKPALFPPVFHFLVSRLLSVYWLAMMEMCERITLWLVVRERDDNSLWRVVLLARSHVLARVRTLEILLAISYVDLPWFSYSSMVIWTVKGILEYIWSLPSHIRLIWQYTLIWSQIIDVWFIYTSDLEIFAQVTGPFNQNNWFDFHLISNQMTNLILISNQITNLIWIWSRVR